MKATIQDKEGIPPGLSVFLLLLSGTSRITEKNRTTKTDFRWKAIGGRQEPFRLQYSEGVHSAFGVATQRHLIVLVANRMTVDGLIVDGRAVFVPIFMSRCL